MSINTSLDSNRGADIGTVNWKVVAVLIAASIVAAVTIIPYSDQLLGQSAGAPDIPYGMLMLAQMVSYLVSSVPAVTLGLMTASSRSRRNSSFCTSFASLR